MVYWLNDSLRQYQPLAADEATGHIYSRYDKIHGHYVYLDKTAKDSELDSSWILGTFAVCTVLVGLKVNSLLTKSGQGLTTSTGQRGPSSLL
jgi:hypothetical protein